MRIWMMARHGDSRDVAGDGQNILLGILAKSYHLGNSATIEKNA